MYGEESSSGQPEKRGRDRYQQLRPILEIVERVVHLVPRPVAQRIFVLSRNRTGLGARALRFALLRRLALDCGELVDVRENVFLIGLAGARFGSRVSIHPLSYIDATGGLIVGDDTSIAHGASIMTTSHNIGDLSLPMRDQGVSGRPVVIGSDVWIGAGVKITGGVTIGRGCVIGAGAVVTADIPPFTVAVGVPARSLRVRRGQ